MSNQLSYPIERECTHCHREYHEGGGYCSDCLPIIWAEESIRRYPLDSILICEGCNAIQEGPRSRACTCPEGFPSPGYQERYMSLPEGWSIISGDPYRAELVPFIIADTRGNWWCITRRRTGSDLCERIQ